MRFRVGVAGNGDVAPPGFRNAGNGDLARSEWVVARVWECLMQFLGCFAFCCMTLLFQVKGPTQRQLAIDFIVRF